MRRISILGATGSIGRSTIDLIARRPDDFAVEALTGASNLGLLAEQARRLGGARGRHGLRPPLRGAEGAPGGNGDRGGGRGRGRPPRHGDRAPNRGRHPARGQRAFGRVPGPARRGPARGGAADPDRLGRLSFRAPDTERYPALALARRVMEEGGLMGAAFNGAKEAALDAFLGRAIRFTDMAPVVTRALDGLGGDMDLPRLSPHHATPSLEEVLEADRLARLRAAETVAGMTG